MLPFLGALLDSTICVENKWIRMTFLDKHLAHGIIEEDENNFVFLFFLGVNSDCKEKNEQKYGFCNFFRQ